MRAYLLLGALLLAGCGENNLPACNDDGVKATVANIAFKNLKKASTNAVLRNDYSLDPYTLHPPTVDAVSTVDSDNKNRVCKAILRLHYDPHSMFAIMSMSREDIDQPIQYEIAPTDDASGYLVNMHVLTN